MKGYGEKTQENIRQSLLFRVRQAGKYHLPEAALCAEELEGYLRLALPALQLLCVGELRQSYEIITSLQFIAERALQNEVQTLLYNAAFLVADVPQTSLFAWTGKFKGLGMAVEVRFVEPKRWGSEAFMLSAAPKHLEQKTLLQLSLQGDFETEEAFYNSVGLAYVPPEVREGVFELELAKQNALPKLLEVGEIRGILHAHSTYSDGKHSLEQMAEACIAQGFEYLGITDHSKSAAYAGGLSEGRLLQQIQEIEQLNMRFAPFKIFKGVEADILQDGALDYDDNILQKLDFVVASIHSGFKMTADKATERLIKAIESPFTTILGHLTGRLLLRREGYPVYIDKIIDACAQNGVVIEINANAWRLELDWRHVHKALDKGVMLSINPDSHSRDSLMDIQWGVAVGRKGGLTAKNTLNTMSVLEISQYFLNRRK
jgi:DNA polymerase (family 10)